jgi:hypothetical protein
MLQRLREALRAAGGVFWIGAMVALMLLITPVHLIRLRWRAFWWPWDMDRR